MTIRDSLLKWSRARFTPRARVSPNTDVPVALSSVPTLPRQIVERAHGRRIDPQYAARPALEFEQIAEELARINRRLQQAEAAASQRRLRRPPR